METNKYRLRTPKCRSMFHLGKQKGPRPSAPMDRYLPMPILGRIEAIGEPNLHARNSTSVSKFFIPEIFQDYTNILFAKLHMFIKN